MRCESCSAPLAPGALECEFCHTATPEGFKVKSAEAAKQRALEQAEALKKQQLEYERQQAELRAAAAQRAAAQQKLNSAGTGAIVTGIIGFFPACGIPFSIAAFLIGMSTRKKAQQQGLQTPGGATAGMVLGAVSFLMCNSLLAFGGYLDHADKQHRAELRASIEKTRHDETLSLPVACALTELKLLDSKYEEYSYSGSSEFTCGKDLAQAGTHAVLSDSDIEISSKQSKVYACLERDPKTGVWDVSQLRRDGKCAEPTNGFAHVAGDSVK